MKSTINWMKDKKYILFCFLILLIAILIIIGINVNAATDEAGQIEKERTLLRSTIAIAQAEDTNGQVTQTALQALLNERNLSTTITQATSTTLQVTFSASSNSYTIDINEGLVYSVAFDANGGTGAPATQYATQGKATKISKTEPTKTGATFLGWATSSTATTAQYLAGAKFIPTANSTLYAVWEARTTYTITFDANGGTGGPTSLTGAEGETVTIPTETPTKEGFKFLNWSTTTAIKGGTNYEPGDTITLTEDLILYALWGFDLGGGGSILMGPRITYKANGGTFSDGSTTMTENSKMITTEIPTRAGYAFDGWKLVSGGYSSDVIGDTYIFAPGDEHDFTSAATLQAVWRQSV